MTHPRLTTIARLLLLPILTFVLTRVTRADTTPLDTIAPLIGQWRIDAKWLTSDKPLKARLVFEWGPGKKFIISKTFVTPADGSEEYERYHEVFGVEDGKLVDHSFDVEGKSHVREFQIDGTVLKSEWKVEDAPVPTKVRQELDLAAGNKMQWRIWIERDGKTEQMMDGTWIKDQPAAK